MYAAYGVLAIAGGKSKFGGKSITYTKRKNWKKEKLSKCKKTAGTEKNSLTYRVRRRIYAAKRMEGPHNIENSAIMIIFFFVGSVVFACLIFPMLRRLQLPRLRVVGVLSHLLYYFIHEYFHTYQYLYPPIVLFDVMHTTCRIVCALFMSVLERKSERA